MPIQQRQAMRESSGRFPSGAGLHGETSSLAWTSDLSSAQSGRVPWDWRLCPVRKPRKRMTPMMTTPYGPQAAVRVAGSTGLPELPKAPDRHQRARRAHSRRPAPWPTDPRVRCCRFREDAAGDGVSGPRDHPVQRARRVPRVRGDPRRPRRQRRLTGI